MGDRIRRSLWRRCRRRDRGGDGGHWSRTPWWQCYFTEQPSGLCMFQTVLDPENLQRSKLCLGFGKPCLKPLLLWDGD